jgi:hypothetical protein
MSGDSLDNILDDLFHGCAFAAYVEIWQETGRFPPDSEATRQRAYRYYEEALAERDRGKIRPAGREPGTVAPAPGSQSSD